MLNHLNLISPQIEVLKLRNEISFFVTEVMIQIAQKSSFVSACYNKIPLKILSIQTQQLTEI